MKIKLLFLGAVASMATAMSAGSFDINGTAYNYDLLEQKEIGPGVIYHRIRIPDYPLNINYMTVDLTNPYNRIETQQGQDQVGKTELLTSAYTRMQNAGKKPLGGQNSNFWVVSGQGAATQFIQGAPYSACLKNGQIATETNCHNDKWNGGAERTGVVGIGYDKDLHIESMSWKGSVKANRWGESQEPEFYLCNKYVRSSGEMALFNSFYGRTKAFQTVEKVDGTWTKVEGKTCEVYLNFVEGYSWTTNQDMKCRVMQVRIPQTAGSLGDYDMCLVGSESYQTLLQELQPGDEVTVKYSWYSCATGEPIRLEQAVAGNAIVLHDGELTPRNEDENYNSMVYSRSAYGKSADGKTLFMFVIDKSTDPVYGISNGCNTSVMSQIMKQLGAATVCNVDAGGSAELMVQGKIVNKTTEGSPRAVANGWMVYSTAPDDEGSNVITRLAFLEPQINVPVYSSYTPVVLGYNAYGELIDENVEGVSFSISPDYGTVDNSVINLNGKVGTTTLTATLGDISVTKEANVMMADVAIRKTHILNDGRKYPIEIVAKVGFKDYSADASRMEWSVDDGSIAEINGGVLQGLANGETDITATLGDFSATAHVTVQLPEGNMMPLLRVFPTEWTLKQYGSTDLQVSEYEKGLKFSFIGNGVSRGAYIQAVSNVDVWSMPKGINLSINPGNATVKKVSMGLVNGFGDSNSNFIITADELPKNEVSTFNVDFDGWFDPTEVAAYPLQFYALRLDMGKSDSGVNYEISIPALQCIYNDYGAVRAISSKSQCLNVYPNPARGFVRLSGIDDNGLISIYNQMGTLMLTTLAEGHGGTAAIDVSTLASGIYYLRYADGNTMKTAKLIIK